MIQPMKGMVFDIQRYTVHDGPGIRTTVFLKGCPLHCLWCSNPEGISPQPQLAIYPKDCIGLQQCGRCVDVCAVAGDVLLAEGDKVVGVDRAACNLCLECARACPTNALRVFGREYTVDELVRLIVADRSYYERSGGGVTLGGGDPLGQWEFARALLKECHRYGIHTCVESELHCSRAAIDAVLPCTDLLITDLKHMDPQQHRRCTGRTNSRILANIRRVVKQGGDVIIRIPVVPGYNDDDANVAAVARFVTEDLDNRIRQLQLLPFRLLGKEKYEALGIAYPLGDIGQPPREEYEPNLERMAATLRSHGIAAVADAVTRSSSHRRPGP